MSKTRSPLFSLDATGTFNNSLTYRKKSNINTVSKYSKPGDKIPFDSSPRQKDQRGIIGLITIRWQCMTPAEKSPWEILAKESRKPLSGYHLFLHTAKTNLPQYLGLDGYWSMNYNIENKITDLSGNGNHGTLSPTYPTNCPTLVDSFDKKYGKAMSVDGTNYNLDIPDGPLWAFGTNAFSISLWFKPLGLNGNWYTLIDTRPADDPNGIWIGVNESRVKVYTNAVKITGTTVINNNTWYNLAIIGNGGTSGSRNVKMFIDTVQVGLWTYDYNFTRDLLMIGNDPLLAGYTWPGLIDDVRIWKRLVGPEEIKLHYNLFR